MFEKKWHFPKQKHDLLKSVDIKTVFVIFGENPLQKYYKYNPELTSQHLSGPLPRMFVIVVIKA